MYRQETVPMIALYLPRLNRAGLKSCLPTVCRAAMGIRYEKLVAIVAVAVIAEKALESRKTLVSISKSGTYL